ncbi:MAG: hypothetical protein GTO22_26515 [Gemmatimonadales bacterium]|nr:hypothetical protein [Gemmatimonadales bacterium]
MVTLEGGNMPTAFPISSVAKLEVSRGKKSNVGRGALIGGLAGASLGAIVAAGACSADLPFGAKPSCSEGDVVAIVALFTVPVTGIGALIGAVTKADRWENVPLDRIRLGPSPVAADGLALSATLRL